MFHTNFRKQKNIFLLDPNWERFNINMEFPKLLSTQESLVVLSLVLLFYWAFLMCGLDVLLRAIAVVKDDQRVWLSEDGLWDHPEPNYRVFSFVAEFFASITAIPLAGGFLLYQALRFSYNAPVVFLYMFDCWMYTCAFFSHMLLWPLLNSVTLASVLSNALYTFGVYSGLAGGPLKNPWVRIPLTLVMWSAIVYLVVVLPPWFGQNGGVPALLAIQTPAVISALSGAFYCWSKTASSVGRDAFKLLIISGVLLCSAMGVSLIEVLYGKQHQANYFGIFPVYHIIIHLLEQVGIYLYGVGVATVEHCMIRPIDAANARIQYTIGGIVPYLAITVEKRGTEFSENQKNAVTYRRSPRLIKSKEL
jgi:hypothetical protein